MLRRMLILCFGVLISCTGLQGQPYALRLLHAQEFVPDPQPEKQAKLQTGWIDAVSKDVVVIDDLASPLASVTVYDQNGFLVNKSSLKAGRYVAFKRNEGETEIRFLEGKGQRPVSTRKGTGTVNGQEGTKKEGLRKVDGVWKN